MLFLRRVLAGVSSLTRGAFILASWLTVALVLLTVQQVVSRYFFQSSSIAMQELQWHLFGFIITLSMAHALDKNGHVRVDILSNRFGAKLRRGIHTIGFFLLIPLSIALTYFGILDVLHSRSYESPVPPNFYSELLATKDSLLFSILSPIEEILRATLLVGEGSSDAGGLEARWIIRAAFPLGMTLLALQSISLFLRSLFPSLNKAEEYSWI
ncbi:MAG: TRAP transporter small permease subunit [Bdellovibrionales bacterium]|nr:TRAP transporter small permease subunit [Bdellovibrionales bacterium]